jgi:hypothetical protein
MRKTIAIVKPQNIKQLAICLAIIRPAAAQSNVGGGKSHFLKNASKGNYSNYIIFDDDAIHYINNIMNQCNSKYANEGMADKYRRSFSKNKWKDIQYFKYIIKDIHNKDQIIDNLSLLHKYSFCKSHAFSYAKLVWALAYQKAHNPLLFWTSTLNNCKSMYRRWVHFSEAKKNGLKITLGKRPWKLKDGTIYGFGKDRNKGKLFKDRTSIDEYKLYGYWISHQFLPNMYVKIIDPLDNVVQFRGLIATGRPYKGSNSKFKNSNKYRIKPKDKYGCTFITIGYKTGHFIDLNIYGMYGISPYDVVSGKGYVKQYVEGNDYLVIDVFQHKFEIL